MRRAAERLPIAEFGLIWWKTNGECSALDIPGALISAKKLIERDQAWGNYILGVIYLKGYGVEADSIKSEFHFKAAADLKNSLALRTLGFEYVNGNEFEKNIETGISLIMRAIELDDETAMYYLGSFYLDGKQVKKDVNLGVTWLTKAAERGSLQAVKLLSKMYRMGQAVPEKNETLATAYLEVAVSFGDAESMCDLAYLYYSGIGKERDREKAAKLFFDSALLQFIPSYGRLGIMLIYGDGIDRDIGSGLYWLEKAACSGDPEAQYNLFLAYETNAISFPGGRREAVTWLTKAAKQGNADAEYGLGILLLNGDAELQISRSTDEATIWFLKSKEHGNEKAATALQMLKSETP